MLTSAIGFCCFFGLAACAISRKERSVAKKKEKAADAVGGFYSSGSDIRRGKPRLYNVSIGVL
jgi:hypothetical protein